MTNKKSKKVHFILLLLSVNIKLLSPFIYRPSKRNFIGLGGDGVNPQFNSSWFIHFTYVIYYCQLLSCLFPLR